MKDITDSSIAMCLSGVCAASNAAQRRSMKGWIFPFLVVPSGSPTYKAPKDLKEAIPGKDRPEERQVGGVVC